MIIICIVIIQVRFFYYRTWHKVSIMLGECSTGMSCNKVYSLFINYFTLGRGLWKMLAWCRT